MSTIANPLRVLLVDDSQTIRRAVETVLQKANCDVVTANDGFEALAVVADWQPELILIDIMMPRVNGYEFCSVVKHNRRFKQIPVILISSREGFFDKAKGRVVGCDGYLTKPFSQTELIKLIQSHVGA